MKIPRSQLATPNAA